MPRQTACHNFTVFDIFQHVVINLPVFSKSFLVFATCFTIIIFDIFSSILKNFEPVVNQTSDKNILIVIYYCKITLLYYNIDKFLLAIFQSNQKKISFKNSKNKTLTLCNFA